MNDYREKLKELAGEYNFKHGGKLEDEH